MELFESNTNWAEVVKPLIEKHKNKKCPLAYTNLFELMVMVFL